MILTCPNCATDFFVEDHLIGRDGREVKCDECGEVWTAHPDNVAVAAAMPVAVEAPVAPEPAASSPMFAPQKTPPAVQRVAPPSRRRLLIALLIPAVVIVALIAFQGPIVKMAPDTGGVYRALGLTAPTPAAHGSPHG